MIDTFGCWCCSKLGIENRREDVLPHHTDGKTKPYAHYKTIPLCDGHHSRYKVDGLHYNPTAWQEKWGSQEEILSEIAKVMVAKYGQDILEIK